MSDYISHDHEHDGIDRRGFLQCMAWAGTGLLWTVSGGILASKTLAEIAKAGTPFLGGTFPHRRPVWSLLTGYIAP